MGAIGRIVVGDIQALQMLDRLVEAEPRIATTIFGADNRRAFRDTAYPWSTIGLVQTNRGSGSGVMIGPRHLLTVSHVIDWTAPPGFVADWVRFTPSYYDGGYGIYSSGDYYGGSCYDYYYWYYGTLAMYQYGGPEWKRWNDAMWSSLKGMQIKTGPNAGSWDPKGPWGPYGGRVFSTAMSAMCLEVYYRFLPLYKVSGRPDEKP